MKRRVTLQAGVADENVDCAELLYHPREHGSDLIFHGDVRPMRVGYRPGFPYFLDDCVSGIVTVNVIDHHVGTRLSQSDRHALSDSGVGPRHQRLLSIQKFWNRDRRCSRYGCGLFCRRGHGAYSGLTKAGDEPELESALIGEHPLAGTDTTRR